MAPWDMTSTQTPPQMTCKVSTFTFSQTNVPFTLKYQSFTEHFYFVSCVEITSFVMFTKL